MPLLVERQTLVSPLICRRIFRVIVMVSVAVRAVLFCRPVPNPYAVTEL